MTPFSRLVRNALERYLGRYEEGPELPLRFIQQIAAFLRFHPGASVSEWMTFTARIARAAYQAGYVRGYEWSEREPDVRTQYASVPTEDDAQGHTQDWNWSHEAPPPPEQLAGLPSRDTFAEMPVEEQVKYLQALSGHGLAGWRVVFDRQEKK